MKITSSAFGTYACSLECVFPLLFDTYS